jgi:hypothetical protein
MRVEANFCQPNVNRLLKAKLNFEFDAPIACRLASAAAETEAAGERDRLTE